MSHANTGDSLEQVRQGRATVLNLATIKSLPRSDSWDRSSLNGGETPRAPVTYLSRVDQLVDRLTHYQKVAGSSPAPAIQLLEEIGT
jgi:hypothetical protein